jgi:hypothetical protein
MVNRGRAVCAVKERLLMMGTAVPETCWAVYKLINKNLLKFLEVIVHLVVFYLILSILKMHGNENLKFIVIFVIVWLHWMLLLYNHCINVNWDLQDRDLIVTSKPEVTKEATVYQFVGLELALGVLRQNIKKKIGNQYTTRWQGLTRSQRQARELISGASPAAKTRLLSFNPYTANVENMVIF